MAKPDIVKGTYLDILIGNEDGPPETFNALCGLTTRNFTEQVNTNDSFIQDCADPEDVPTRRVIPTGKQWDLSGEGLLNLTQEAALQAAIGVTKNYQFVIDRPAGSIVGAGVWEGPAMLTNRQVGGSTGDGQFANVSLTLVSDGDWTFTPAV